MNRREFLAGTLGAGMAGLKGKAYRVAVIGHTGRGDYGHDLDTTWLHVPNVEIAAVADAHAEGRAKAQERLKAANGYADYREMLRREKPDLVSIAPRWPDAHRDMLLACADSGVRGALLEKPVSRTLQEADAMLAAADRAKMKVAVCHQTRISPRLAVVKELIAAGRLGDLIEIRTRGKEDHRGGGEDMMVLGSHLMDLMRFLAGDPQWCFGRVTQGDKPATQADAHPGGEEIGPIAGDHIVATYGFPNGVNGYFGTLRARHHAGARFATHVFGTKGVFSIAHGTLPTVFFLEDPSWTLFQKGGQWQPVTSAGVGAEEPLKDGSLRAGNALLAQDLIRSIEEDRQPVSSLADGRAALEMILAVYESHRRNAPVSLPLANRRHPLESRAME